MTRRFEVFGVVFDRVDAGVVLDFVLERDRTAPFAYVVTPNVDHLGRLRRSPGLRTAYDEAVLRLLDSRVVAGVARLCGVAPPPVVTGADLLAAMLPRCEARAGRVAVVGLDPGVMASLRARFPGLDFLHCNPPRGFDLDPVRFAAARDFVIEAQADCTIFAVGSPRQEVLAQAVRRSGKAVGIGLCVGAAPLFLSGALRRAPVPLRAMGLEWAWRLACEPRRLGRRYLADGPKVILALIRELRRPALPGADSWAIDKSGINGMEAQCSGRQTHDGVSLGHRSAFADLPDQS